MQVHLVHASANIQELCRFRLINEEGSIDPFIKKGLFNCLP